MDTLEAILNIEENEQATESEILESWACLIKAGLVWQLQGSYGRGASALIEQGVISSEGEILVEI